MSIVNKVEVLTLLCQRFPLAFFMYQGHRKPLKVGIRQDLEAALGDAVDAEMLRQALKYYVVNACYLGSQRAGAERIDLLGEPAGLVTEAESQNAKKAIAGLRAKKKLKPKPKPKPKPPAPKRDSLSALREAARKRRALADVGGGA